MGGVSPYPGTSGLSPGAADEAPRVRMRSRSYQSPSRETSGLQAIQEEKSLQTGTKPSHSREVSKDVSAEMTKEWVKELVNAQKDRPKSVPPMLRASQSSPKKSSSKTIGWDELIHLQNLLPQESRVDLERRASGRDHSDLLATNPDQSKFVQSNPDTTVATIEYPPGSARPKVPRTLDIQPPDSRFPSHQSGSIEDVFTTTESPKVSKSTDGFLMADDSPHDYKTEADIGSLSSIRIDVKTDDDGKRSLGKVFYV